MSDYRRWISYIYSYEHGEKKNNAGYARIELKDGRVKMTIYMTPGRKDGSVKVCFYKGQQGHLAAALLGSLDLSVPSPVFRMETSASNVMESGLFFVEMNGLLLVKEDGQYYASSWEDGSLEEDVARDIIQLLNKNKKEERKEKTLKEETLKEESLKEEAEGLKKQQENTIKTRPLKVAETEVMPEASGQAESMGTKTEEGTKEDKKEKRNKRDSGCRQGNEPGQDGGCEQDNESGQDSECGQDSNFGNDTKPGTATKPELVAKSKADTKIGTNAKPESEPKEAKKTETTRLAKAPYKNCCMGASPAERIFCCLPPMYPFEEAKYEKGVRMTPQDIGMLPRALWKLAGNSFLLHAYYTYHHLLFVKQRQKDGPLYFLMLPGVYSEKEQNLALMFGFCNFCAVKRKALEQGDFGYWYLEVTF